jgi:hypothetical protein
METKKLSISKKKKEIDNLPIAYYVEAMRNREGMSKADVSGAMGIARNTYSDRLLYGGFTEKELRVAGELFGFVLELKVKL